MKTYIFNTDLKDLKYVVVLANSKEEAIGKVVLEIVPNDSNFSEITNLTRLLNSIEPIVLDENRNVYKHYTMKLFW